MTSTHSLAALDDRIAVAELFAEFGYRVDTKDWQGYADLYDPEEGLLLVPGREPIRQPEIADVAARTLGRWARTHHMITNIQTSVDGERARARAYVHAVHVRGDTVNDDAWVLGGSYDCALTRVEGTWKFLTLSLTRTWQRGSNPHAVTNSPAGSQ